MVSGGKTRSDASAQKQRRQGDLVRLATESETSNTAHHVRDGHDVQESWQLHSREDKTQNIGKICRLAPYRPPSRYTRISVGARAEKTHLGVLVEEDFGRVLDPRLVIHHAHRQPAHLTLDLHTFRRYDKIAHGRMGREARPSKRAKTKLHNSLRGADVKARSVTLALLSSFAGHYCCRTQPAPNQQHREKQLT